MCCLYRSLPEFNAVISNSEIKELKSTGHLFQDMFSARRVRPKLIDPCTLEWPECSLFKGLEFHVLQAAVDIQIQNRWHRVLQTLLVLYSHDGKSLLSGHLISCGSSSLMGSVGHSHPRLSKTRRHPVRAQKKDHARRQGLLAPPRSREGSLRRCSWVPEGYLYTTTQSWCCVPCTSLKNSDNCASSTLRTSLGVRGGISMRTTRLFRGGRDRLEQMDFLVISSRQLRRSEL